MLWTHTKRIISSGFLNFWRNGTVTVSAVLVMIVALSVIGSVVFVGALLRSTLAEVSNKIDVRVYFVGTASEANDILPLKVTLEKMPEVASVEYISAEQALVSFKEKHKNDPSILGALAELDENPLGPALSIKAKELSQYESITDFLKGQDLLSRDGSSVVREIDYEQNDAKRLAIEKITQMVTMVETVGFIVTVILVVLAISIIFNTIRLVIYMSREEISVMQLVGASHMYIRGPFFVTGVMYGLIGGIIVLILFYPITYGLISFTGALGITNLFTYYIQHFAAIAALILGSGALIGGISSYLAVKQYLKI